MGGLDSRPVGDGEQKSVAVNLSDKFKMMGGVYTAGMLTGLPTT